MTSDLCSEDVVVRITSPQIITAGGAGGGGGAGLGARVGASSAGVELGRRLLLAARAGDTPQVLELMAAGAPFSTDWLGTSPLHLAAGNAHADTCAVLLRAGVSRDARTKVERTPLHLAACGGHARVVRLLLDAGADVAARDMLRMTPLHWAAQHGHAAAAAELLRAGADPLVRNKFHKSALALAQQLKRAELVRLMEDALKEREAARSVSALVEEEMAETTTEEPQIQPFEAVQRVQGLKPIKSKQNEKNVKQELNIECESPSPSGAAAQLLRKHGITLLPTDDGSTVLNALQSGRTVVLSDAGKLMLKESATSPTPTVSKASIANQAKGMVLTATPVKSPPKPGVKIFTLNNKLLAVPKDNKIPVKKIINPQDMQMKFIQLPPDAKIISSSKIVPMKAKNRVASRAATPTLTSLTSQRPAVKIIMNKSNFNRLIATASRANQSGPEVQVNRDTTSIEALEGDVEVCDQTDSPHALRDQTDSTPALRDQTGSPHTPRDQTSSPHRPRDQTDSTHALRAQLAAAQRSLAAVRRELSHTRARLAQYERLTL